jgi:hypothetical protein
MSNRRTLTAAEWLTLMTLPGVYASLGLYVIIRAGLRAYGIG